MLVDEKSFIAEAVINGNKQYSVFLANGIRVATFYVLQDAEFYIKNQLTVQGK
jgi:hypothetical protein